MADNPSKREQYERLANPDPRALEAFAELDRKTQLEIIHSIESPSKNPKVAKAERELSRRRGAAYRKHLKPKQSE